LWIGPAPVRPFNSLYHPFNWRGWYDFGTGALGDMALHTFHMVFRALKLTHPTNVCSTTTLVFEPAPPGERDPEWSRGRRVKFPETYPHSQLVTWDFPARGDLPAVRLHWYDGGLKPPRPADMDPAESFTSEGSYFVGDKGVLLIRGTAGGQSRTGRPTALLPEAKFRDFTPPPKTIPRTIGHYQEWIAAAKGGPPANCNFDFASLIAETALIGVISARTGKHLAWDAANMRFTNDEDANQYLNPPYRSGWAL
jgi:predicted dehydrogenase